MIRKLRAFKTAPLALAYWLGIAGAKERSQGIARVLMFHGTPRPLAGQFERQMRYLRAHFNVVPLGSIVAAAASAAPDIKPQVALTFDDGLRNNLQVAYPVLRKLGLPATFFVCPALAQDGRWLWNHEARRRLIRLDAAARAKVALECGAPAGGGIEDLIGWMKTLDVRVRAVVEERLRSATPRFVPTAAETEEFDIAGWDELRRLDPEVITIGSHTLTHPILPWLDAEEREREIGHSRRELEAKLQRTVDLFAYPNGDLDAEVHRCVQRHYRGAVTTEPSWVAAGCDPHLIPRGCAPLGALRLAWNLHREAAPD
jgi:peptidoglycan/xylan/chitin deacetylase (PgdA/CDA1 family)